MAGTHEPRRSAYSEQVIPSLPLGPAQLAVVLATDPSVWVFDEGSDGGYHRVQPGDVLGCRRKTGHGRLVARTEAVSNGGTPCARCYPNGDDTVALVGGQFPVVLIGQDHGEPVLAEVRKVRRNGRIIQVVYRQSRTGAWVKASRVVDAPTAKDSA